MIYALIPLLLLLAVWVGAVYRRLRQLDDNIKIAMEQIGLQLSSRFRALETLLELLRSYGPSAQLVLPPPSIHALSTPAQVLEPGAAACAGHELRDRRGREPPGHQGRQDLPALHRSGQLLQPHDLYQQPDLQRFGHTVQQYPETKAFCPAGRGFWALPRGNICSLHRTPRWSALPSPPRPLNRPLKKNPPEIVPAVSLQKTKASAGTLFKNQRF